SAGSPRRLDRIAQPARSWVVKIRPTRPRTAWLWLVWSASVLLAESIVPVQNWSSATGRDPVTRLRQARMSPMPSPLAPARDPSVLLGPVTVLDVRYQTGGPD